MCSTIYPKNRNKLNEYRRKYYKALPSWIKTYNAIIGRCNYKSNKFYEYYGGRGIKCLITKEELKKLWFRDKGYLLKEPSIDRIDGNKSYTYKNCRYIELKENRKKQKNTIIYKFRKAINNLKKCYNYIYDKNLSIKAQQERKKLIIECKKILKFT